MDDLALDRIASAAGGALSALVLGAGLWTFDARFLDRGLTVFSTLCAQMIGLAVGFYVVAYAVRTQRTIFAWFATGFLALVLGAAAAIITGNGGPIATLMWPR